MFWNLALKDFQRGQLKFVWEIKISPYTWYCTMFGTKPFGCTPPWLCLYRRKKKVEANSNTSFSGKCFSEVICNVPYKHTKYNLILIIITTVLLLLILLSTSHKILTSLWEDLRMPYLVCVGIKFPVVWGQKVRATQDKTHSIIMPVPFPSYVIFSHCYFYL